MRTTEFFGVAVLEGIMINSINSTIEIWSADPNRCVYRPMGLVHDISTNGRYQPADSGCHLSEANQSGASPTFIDVV